MEFYKSLPVISEQEPQQRIGHFINTPVAAEDRKRILQQLITFIDLTTLNGDDTEQRVISLCEKALKILPRVAAVCVYPNFAKTVRKQLEPSAVKTAVVATGFPSGQTFSAIRKAEAVIAVHEGAEEVDMVIQRGTFLAGDFETVFNDIQEIKALCGEARLKVILETGELQTPENIKNAAALAIEAGADFIKTSTGKIKPAATPEAVLVMTDVIKAWYEKTGRKIGIKAAGGISDAATALQYYQIVRQNLGMAWMTPELFRIGASSLLDNLLDEL